MRRHLTVLLATYNEADSIGRVLEAVSISARSLIDRSIETDVLLADDNSPDGTARVASIAAAALGLPLTVLPGERAGLGAAYLRAFRFLSNGSETDLIVTMDADGQHDGSTMAALVEHLLDNDLDMVIGSRWVGGSSTPGMSWWRRLNSQAGNSLFRLVTGTKGVSDATNSFRATTAEVVRGFNPVGLSVDGYSVLSSLVALSQATGFSIDEVPIEFRPRLAGRSKLRLGDYPEFIYNLFKIRRAARKARGLTA